MLYNKTKKIHGRGKMLDIIVNPNTKHLKSLLGEIADKLNAEKVPFDFHMGENKEQTRAIAGRLSESGPVKIVAVGGDGTVNDILCGITVPENVELGIIPVGTGNDFAEKAKIPTGLPALDLILHSPSKYTDYIDCGEYKSLNIAGLGIDVDILERCYRMKGDKRSKYFRSLLASLVSYKGQKIEVTVGGKTFFETAFIAAVCNGSQFGGGITICPPAVLDDGKLDLVVISCPKRSRILFELLALKRGKILDRPIAKHILCEEARIVQTEGKIVELDGELTEARSLNARVVSGKLRVFRG